MKNRLLATFTIGFLFLAPSVTRADVSVAKEVETKKVHFDSSSTSLSPDSKMILDIAISLLTQMNEGYTLKVVGYTDAKGPEDLNQDLSFQRANAVAAYIIARGIDRNRILIQGLGRENPVADNESDDGRMRNRRVEFKFLSPDVSDMRLTASNVMVAQAAKDPQILEITPAPAVEAQPTQEVQAAEEVKVQTQPASINPPAHEPVVESAPATSSVRRQRARDTMLSPVKRSRDSYISNHVYEDRKRAEAGQSYIQVTPMIATLDGLSGLGAADDRLNSKVSFRGEAGWISFLDDAYEAFVIAKGYGSFIRFAQDGPMLIAERQREFTYGGELGIGRYFHPNVSIQMAAGYGAELMYRPSAGNIELDNEFIGHLSFTLEAVVWRFSQKGDLGLEGTFSYYDFGRGIMETGSGYNLNVFMDYDFLRAGLGFTMQNFETTNYDYSTWNFGPNLRLYF